MLEMNRLPALTRSWQRIPAWAEVCFLLFFLWKTKARNALLSVILYLVVFFVLSLRKADQLRLGKPSPKLQPYGRFSLPEHIFCFLQLPGVISLFSFLESAGKDLHRAWRYGCVHCVSGSPPPSSVPTRRRAVVWGAASSITHTYRYSGILRTDRFVYCLFCTVFPDLYEWKTSIPAAVSFYDRLHL